MGFPGDSKNCDLLLQIYWKSRVFPTIWWVRVAWTSPIPKRVQTRRIARDFNLIPKKKVGTSTSWCGWHHPPYCSLHLLVIWTFSANLKAHYILITISTSSWKKKDVKNRWTKETSIFWWDVPLEQQKILDKEIRKSWLSWRLWKPTPPLTLTLPPPPRN